MVDTAHSGFGKYPLQFVALGLLMDSPSHGYALYKDFQDMFGSIWKAGQTKFYVTLSAMEDQGLLSSSMEPQPGRPARKVYRLTEAGRGAFLAWLHEPMTSMRSMRVEFIARLRFFDLLDLPGVDALVDRQIAAVQTMIEEWEAAVQGSGAVENDPFYALVYDYRLRQAYAIIDWLNATRLHIHKGRLNL